MKYAGLLKVKPERLEWEPSGIQKGAVRIYAVDADTLIADTYTPGIEKNHLKSRYMISMTTGDHGYANAEKDGGFSKVRNSGIIMAVTGSPSNSYEGYTMCGGGMAYSGERINRYKVIVDQSAEKLDIRKDYDEITDHNIISIIKAAETRNYDEKTLAAEKNRRRRTASEMDLVPALPEGLTEWYQKASFKNRTHYLVWRKENKAYRCTGCGKSMTIEESAKLRPIKDHYTTCPNCGIKVTLNFYKEGKDYRYHADTKYINVVQPMKTGMAVLRILSAYTMYEGREREPERTEITEINRHIISYSDKATCNDSLFGWMYEPASNRSNWKHPGNFDFETGKRWVKCKQTKRCGWYYYSYYDYIGTDKAYIYPTDIMGALKNTVYEDHARSLQALADLGARVSVEKFLLCAVRDETLDFVELAARGRFKRLLEDAFDRHRYSDLCKNIEPNCDVNGLMMLSKQARNRLRDADGGLNVLEWLLDAERTGQKIPDDVLKDLTDWKIWPEDIGFMDGKMSLIKFRNYLKRQMESYKGKTAKEVISQWIDYLEMAKKLKMKTDDPMIYRPTELKRRHNQCVAEINRRAEIERQKKNAQRAAEEDKRLRKQFPGISKRLKDLAEKYNFEDETYMVRMPRSLYEIREEGYNLHHCAGATDRYFDRMERQETYIMFLRTKKDPDRSYYTVEVEPGGAIRQHRGMYDEEKDLDKIKPFLKKWQKWIRKKMTEEDRKLEELSKIGREESLRDRLERFGKNDRVYKALLEDLMEAEDELSELPACI